MLQSARASQILRKEEYRATAHKLSQFLASQINSQIQFMLEERQRQITAIERQKHSLEQLEREKRIMQSAVCEPMLQTAQRSFRGQRKILGNLSVVMGPGKKGQIVMREGDEIGQLVRSFIQLYGLKKDVFGTICESLR